ncbi:phosphodiesterase [Solimonas marina]|uniref:Phosphodiesterase n=1 Tax=Solimonas marina TaxID=2714601 RepID=A0A969W9M7_9GAMM|nr:phosphodiesterase [Solimonas marina]NKF22454.1 phosphodiesterase [Solimonas marina]
MRKTISAAALALGVIAAGPALADVLAVPAAQSPAPTALPQRGEKQAAVLREFGQPKVRHAPVGGSGPKRPPITRWDYDGWSVFFERTTVVDVVVKGAPPPLQHADELQPVR